MRARKLTAALAAVPVALAGAVGVAHADIIKNTIDVTPAVASITAGGSVAVGYRVQVENAGDDGQGGCNAADGSPLHLTLSVPVGVTVSGSALQAGNKLVFTQCGQPQTLTFSAAQPGQYAISSSGVDSGTGRYTNLADWTLDVTSPTPTDTTAPVITKTLDPATPDGSNGWYTGTVSLDWTVTENESPGTLQTVDCQDTTINSDQQATTYACSATSQGGSSSDSVTVKRDGTAPDVALVGGPAAGASYYFGEVPGAPTCTASDATSGLAGPCQVTGHGTSVGSHTVVAAAEDLAGNQASDARTYTVLAWTARGFTAPVDMGGVVNTVKNGSTVPLKFEVFAGSTELDSTAVVKEFRQREVTCTSGAVTDDIEVVSTGGTSLRYDTAGGQFVQNWQTPKRVGACYDVTVTFQDGTAVTGKFKLK